MLSPLARNRLEMALRNNGYHIPCEVPEGWLAADATFAPGRCFVAYAPDGRNAIVATSLVHVGRAFAEEGGVDFRLVSLPDGAVAAFKTHLAHHRQHVWRR